MDSSIKRFIVKGHSPASRVIIRRYREFGESVAYIQDLLRSGIDQDAVSDLAEKLEAFEKQYNVLLVELTAFVKSRQKA